jgi:hypothetical protein
MLSGRPESAVATLTFGNRQSGATTRVIGRFWRQTRLTGTGFSAVDQRLASACPAFAALGPKRFATLVGIKGSIRIPGLRSATADHPGVLLILNAHFEPTFALTSQRRRC